MWFVRIQYPFATKNSSDRINCFFCFWIIWFCLPVSRWLQDASHLVVVFIHTFYLTAQWVQLHKCACKRLLIHIQIRYEIHLRTSIMFINMLHSISKRIWNGIQHICRTNEQNFRQINWHIQKVIKEIAILLWIQQLEQYRTWIALIWTAENFK